MSLLKEGDNLLIAHRRIFEKDESRFFVGKVAAYDAGIVKVIGHSFVRDVISGRIIEKAEVRIKLFSLTSGTLLVYQLPANVHMDSFILHAEEGRLRATDGQGFVMNLADHAHAGRM